MRVFPVTLAISVALNAASLLYLNQAVRTERSKVLHHLQIEQRNKAGSLQFEFVEAPAAPGLTEASPESKKISDRNTANQDASPDKVEAQGAPKTPVQGPADQLEQRQALIQRQVPPSPAPVAVQEKTHTPKPAPDQKGESKEPTEIVKPSAESAILSAPPMPPPRPVAVPQDKITTQEMSKAASQGAKLYGLTSFEATGSGMGQYMKTLKEKIWLAWFPYISFKYPQDFYGSKAVIRFTLGKQGQIRSIQVVESKGTELFATFCVEAIQRAGNFGDLPEEVLDLIGKEELEINFGFHYH